MKARCAHFPLPETSPPLDRGILLRGIVFAGALIAAHAFGQTDYAPAYTISTLAGNPEARGSADGTGATASFDVLSGIAVDTAGNVYVADTGNNTIRDIISAGVVTSLAGADTSNESGSGQRGRHRDRRAV